MSDYSDARKQVGKEVRATFDTLREELGAKIGILAGLLVLFLGAFLVGAGLINDRIQQTQVLISELKYQVDIEKEARVALESKVAILNQAKVSSTVDTSIAQVISEAQIRKLESKISHLEMEVFKEGQYTRIGLEWAIIGTKLGWKVLTRTDVGILYKYDNPYEPPDALRIDNFSGFDVLNGRTGYFLVWAGTNEDPSALDGGYQFYRVRGVQLDQKLWVGGNYREFAKAVGMTSDLPEYSSKKFTVPIAWWSLSEAEYQSLSGFVTEWSISK